MMEMIAGAKDLSEKSINDVINMENLREFIKYKYPLAPQTDEHGLDIYGEVASKVDTKWEEGYLLDMKSRSRSRHGSPTARGKQRKWG